MTNDISSIEYKNWLATLKQQFAERQVKAAMQVNAQLLEFYWQLGRDIIEKQRTFDWGDSFIAQLSDDLQKEFPQIKGFSRRNLTYIRRWVLFWQPMLTVNGTIAQQAVAQMEVKEGRLVEQLVKVPWGHHLKIISKSATVKQALFYVQQTVQHGWSRNVLTHQLESQLWQRQGSAVTNFSDTLPASHSDLAQQTIKDPYHFDFLNLTPEFNERELETALIQHITEFLLELGAGFAYVGKQVALDVGEREFFIDLLFYHIKLHCYVVVELKTGEFQPEYAGKLNFYIKAVDEQLRGEQDGPSIGILLCKEKDKLVAEYALSDINKPIGIAEYQLTQSLPANLQTSLPSIEQLEIELKQDLDALESQLQSSNNGDNNE